MKKALQRAAGAAALLAAISSGSARAVQVIKNDDVTLDLGGRFQLTGELENSTNNVSLAPGNVGPRDNTRIYLFQTENRLKVSGLVDTVKFHFEDALGGEAYAGSNNLYDLVEFNAEVPVTDGLSVVAGLFKLPSNIASASDEEHMIFTEHSELLNMFFNQGYDNGLMVKYHIGLFDALLGTSTGTPNLPQRYLPETFQFPPPVFSRIGFGNIKDDEARRASCKRALRSRTASNGRSTSTARWPMTATPATARCWATRPPRPRPPKGLSSTAISCSTRTTTPSWA